MADMAVAKTILEQLGGRKFRVMTGARAFVGGENFLSFRFPRANRVNYCKITLSPLDTYSIEFGLVHGDTYDKRWERGNVYCETLASNFSEVTGLATRLF